jgi:hypothetical protein
MKKKDHKMLGEFLLRSSRNRALLRNRLHQKLFILGCISPDFIPFTYFRGFSKSRALLGHNAKYSAKHIQKSLNRFQANGLYHWWDVLRFGALMHYMADSFTFPHAESYRGDMQAHRRYELMLHPKFIDYLENRKKCLEQKADSLSTFFLQKRAAYERGTPSFERDCRYIVEICQEVFERICLDRVSSKKV